MRYIFTAWIFVIYFASSVFASDEPYARFYICNSTYDPVYVEGHARPLQAGSTTYSKRLHRNECDIVVIHNPVSNFQINLYDVFHDPLFEYIMADGEELFITSAIIKQLKGK